MSATTRNLQDHNLPSRIVFSAVLNEEDEVRTGSQFLLAPSEFTAHGNDVFNMSGCQYFPRVACVGVPKAATSSIFVMLHECLSMCYTKKEARILENVVVNDVYAQAHLCQRYKDITKVHRNNCLLFDGSPNNGIFRTAAALFRASGTKVFAVLRDPLARIVSMFNMYIKWHRPLCQRASNVELFQRKLLDEFHRYANETRIEFSSFTSSNTHFELEDSLILKSLYDRLLEVYRALPLYILFFEDVVSCSDRLFDTLQVVIPSLSAENLQCLRKWCPKVHRNSAKSRCSNVAITDIPEQVKQFITSRNTWYYSAAVRNLRR